MTNYAQPQVVINYVSQRKKIIVNKNNQPSQLIIQTDYNLNETYNFQIINAINKIVQLDVNTTYQLYGSYIDSKNQVHVLFYTLGVTPKDNTLSFLVNTYNSEYLAYVKNNRTPIEISIVAKQNVQGQTRSYMVLRDNALANPRGYIEGQAPTDIVYQNVFNSNVPVSGAFGAGENISLAQDYLGQSIPSFAFGDNLSATSTNQFVVGYNNEPDATKAFIVANSGNIFTVDYEGNVEAGDLNVGAISATSITVNGEDLNQVIDDKVEYLSTAFDDKLSATEDWATDTFETKDSSTSAYNSLAEDIDDLANGAVKTNSDNIEALSGEVSDLSTNLTTNYYTKANIDTTTGAIDERLTAIENDYTTSAQVSSIVESYNYITSADIPTQVSVFENDAEYVTSGELTGELNAYAKKSDITDFITSSDLTDYATTGWVEEQQYATTGDLNTASTSILDTLTSNYVQKTELPADIDDFATSGQVSSIVSSVVTSTYIHDFGFITNTEDVGKTYNGTENGGIKVDNTNNTISISASYLSSDALNGYGDKNWVESNFLSTSYSTTIEGNSQAIADIQSVTGTFALTSDIPTSGEITGLAKDYVDTLNIDTTYATKSEIADLATSAEVSSIVEGYGYQTAAQVSAIASSYAGTDVDYETVFSMLSSGNTDTLTIYKDTVNEKIVITAAGGGSSGGDKTYHGTANGGINVDNVANTITISASYLSSDTFIPTKISDLTDDSDFATSAQVSSIVEGYNYITSSQIPNTYALKTDVDTASAAAVQAATGWVDEQGYLTAHQSLTAYATSSWVDTNYAKKGEAPTDVYTKSEVDTAIASASAVVTSWVDDQGYITSIPTSYALKSDIPTDVATSGYVQSASANAVNVATAWVDGKNYLVQADLNGYAQTSDIAEFATSGQVSSIVEGYGYATEGFVTGQGYITNSALTDYAKKSDIPTATINSLTSKVNTIESDYTTSAQVSSIASAMVEENIPQVPSAVSQLENDLNFITLASVPSVEGLASETYVNTVSTALSTSIVDQIPNSATIIATASAAATGWVDDQGYLTAHQSLEGYALSTDVDSAIEAASGQITGWVEDQHYLTQHQSLADYALSSDVTSDIATATGVVTAWVGEQNYLTAHQSLENYYNKTEVDGISSALSAAVDNANYLTDIPTSYALKSDIPTDVATSGYVQSASGNAFNAATGWVEEQNYLTGVELDDYAKKQWVEDKNYLTAHQDLTAYALSADVTSDIEAASATITSWVSDQNYLTAHQSLDNYYNKEQVDNISSALSTAVDDAGYLTEHQSLANYYTSAQVDDKIATASAEVTGWVNDQNYLTAHQSLDGYALSADVDEAIQTASSTITSWVNEQGYLTDVPTSYATSAWVDQNYAKVGDVPTDVYTKTEVNEISSALSTAVDNAGYLTEHQSLADYALSANVDTSITSAMNDIKDWADNKFLTEHQSLANYYTSAQVDAISTALSTAVSDAGYLTAHQSLAAYALSTDVDEAIQTASREITGWVNDQNYLTAHQSLEDYYTSAQVDSAIEAASGEVTGWVNSQGYLTEHQSLTSYALSADVDTAIENVSGQITGWVEDQNYLTGHQSLEGLTTQDQVSGIASGVASAVVADYITTSGLAAGIGIALNTVDNSLNLNLSAVADSNIAISADQDNVVWLSTNIGETVEAVSAEITGWVNEQGYLTEHQSLEDYYTSAQVDSAIETASSVVTSWVNDQGYLTAHQSLENYALSSDVTNDIATATGVVTSWVDEQNYLTAHQSLANYALSTDVDAAIATASAQVTGWVEDQHYLTAHQSLDDYATKTLVETTSGEITGWVNEQGYLTAHQSLEGYALSADVDNSITSAMNDIQSWANNKFLTEHQSLAAYATSAWVTDELTAYALSTDVNSALSLKADADQISTYIAGTNVSITSSNVNEYTIAATDTTYTSGIGIVISGDTNIIAVDQEWLEGFVANLGYITQDSDTLYHADEETLELTVVPSSEQSPARNVFSVNTTWLNNFLDQKGYLTSIPTSYALKSDIPTATINDISGKVDTLGAASASWLVSSDLANYALSADVTSDIEAASAAITSWVDEQNYLTAHQSLANYYTSAQVDEAIQSASGQVTGWVNDQNYLTAHQSLEGYALSSDVDTSIATATGVVTSWVEQKNYLTAHQSLANYALSSDVTSDIATATGVVTSWVDEQNYLTAHQSLNGYATQAWVQQQNYLTAHQSLDAYALSSDVEEDIAAASAQVTGWVNQQGYLTEHQSLEGYALSANVDTSIATATGVVTSWVNDQNYLTSVPTSYATKQYVDDISSALSTTVSDAGYLTAHQSLENYATKEQVSGIASGVASSAVEDYIALSGLSAGTGLAYESSDNSLNVNLSANPNSNITIDVDQDGVIWLSATAAGGGATYTAGSGIAISNENEISVTGMVTTDQITAYALSSDVDTAIETVSGQITGWVDSQGYLTAHQSLDGYATSANVSSIVTGYVDEVSSNFTVKLGQSSDVISSISFNQDLFSISYTDGDLYVDYTPSIMVGYQNQDWSESRIAHLLYFSNDFTLSQQENEVSVSLNTTNIVDNISGDIYTAISGDVDDLITSKNYLTAITVEVENSGSNEFTGVYFDSNFILDSQNIRLNLNHIIEDGQIATTGWIAENLSTFLSGAGSVSLSTLEDNTILISGAAGGGGGSVEYTSLTPNLLAVDNTNHTLSAAIQAGGGGVVPTDTADLTNSAGYITVSDITNKQRIYSVNGTVIDYDPAFEVFKTTYSGGDVVLSAVTDLSGQLGQNQVATFEEWITFSSSVTSISEGSITLIGEWPSSIDNSKTHVLVRRLVDINGTVTQYVSYAYSF